MQDTTPEIRMDFRRCFIPLRVKKMKDDLEKNKIDAAGLEMITGGMGNTSQKEQMMRIECPFCHDIFQADVQKASVKCPTCHKIITLKG